ncbi:MAG TPA: c-type cytochrome, partial [Roseiarcus sp.]|nr:c-type cytochrome [Roseiarcus sp.]
MPDRIARSATLAIAATLAAGVVHAADPYGIGRPATPQEIAGWDIDVSPSGAGLPPGRGDVGQGEAIFAEKCASCHGAHGEGKPM